jgi:hypothetical protein
MVYTYHIGANAFSNCYNLDISDGKFVNVGMIEEYAFENCTSLTRTYSSAIGPWSSWGYNYFFKAYSESNGQVFQMTTVEKGAFKGCSNLTHFSILPAIFHDEILQNCTNLQVFHLGQTTGDFDTNLTFNNINNSLATFSGENSQAWTDGENLPVMNRPLLILWGINSTYIDSSNSDDVNTLLNASNHAGVTPAVPGTLATPTIINSNGFSSGWNFIYLQMPQ